MSGTMSVVLCFMLFQTWYRDILCCKMHALCCKISGTTFFLCATIQKFYPCGVNPCGDNPCCDTLVGHPVVHPVVAGCCGNIFKCTPAFGKLIVGSGCPFMSSLLILCCCFLLL